MTETPPLLACHDLSKTYPDGQVHAVREVSLAIRQGESVAITGPSGSGKTTLLHLLGGLDRPTAGEVLYRGQPLSVLNPDQFRMRHAGFIFQNFFLLPSLNALENVQIPMFETDRTRTQRVDRARQLLEEVGLGHRARHRPSRLSIGERQRVAIARSLANDPDLIFADEPTGNLDTQTQTDILNLLRRIRADRNVTLLMVTHSLDVAASTDREIRFRDGRIQS